MATKLSSRFLTAGSKAMAEAQAQATAQAKSFAERAAELEETTDTGRRTATLNVGSADRRWPLEEDR